VLVRGERKRSERIGLAFATDSDIWHYAIQQEAVIITKHHDSALLDWLIPLWPEIMGRIQLGTA
jgi:predicted nuclease of predicted toxin-antitoxin system